MSLATPPGPPPVVSLRSLVRSSCSRASDEAIVRARIERSASGATTLSDLATSDRDEDPAGRIELDLTRVDPGSHQALAALFAKFFSGHPGARAGRLCAILRGRVVPGAFGFGHLAISRPVFQATEIRPESDVVDPA